MSLSHLRSFSSSSEATGPTERLTAEEEKSMAREIRRAEQAAREAVAGIDVADDILMRRPKRVERTRAGAVDRLEEAVRAVAEGRQGQREIKELRPGRPRPSRVEREPRTCGGGWP